MHNFFQHTGKHTHTHTECYRIESRVIYQQVVGKSLADFAVSSAQPTRVLAGPFRVPRKLQACKLAYPFTAIPP